MIYGIIHINSIAFVGLAAIFFYLSIESDVKKVKNLHKNKKKGIKEAQNSFDNFFEDKISSIELNQKAENNQTIKDVLTILKHGGIEEDLILGIQKIYGKMDNSYSKLKNDYEYLATIMPIIGMIGTIAGLLMMFAEPTQAEDFEKKFAGLSLALSTTLYASLFTILWFKPCARSVEKWQLDLQTEFEDLEISIRKFYHKVNVLEFIDVNPIQNEEEVDEKQAV
jgi:flagellar motor component MotA